jgi:3-phenylpropionate/trans-cinnamate dioxygenase ferredoxin subunit
MSAGFVLTVNARDVKPGDVVAIEVRGTPIAIANVDGTFYAFDDTCTHEQCSLADGELSGTTIACMCHGAEFDVRTGQVLAPPAPSPVKVYRIRVDGDRLQVDV